LQVGLPLLQGSQQRILRWFSGVLPYLSLRNALSCNALRLMILATIQATNPQQFLPRKGRVNGPSWCGRSGGV
jgi:hypothetical protein